MKTRLQYCNGKVSQSMARYGKIWRGQIEVIAGAFLLGHVQLACSASDDGRCVIGLEHTGELAFATQAAGKLAEFGLGLEKF